ncbi:MAG: SRPBCC family protein [Chitinophagaceae bacterium]|nr:SRPBCC family protein [Oligoflexus sp.]
MENTLKKQLEIAAPVSKVWKALSDSRQFGEWFHVQIDEPFVAGKTTRARHTYPGGEHIHFAFEVKKIEPETYFSMTWHPYAIDDKRDYSKEEQTLIEFRLEPTAKGTLLLVTESGFEKVSADRRAEAFSMHNEGWIAQLKNIENYVTK